MEFIVQTLAEVLAIFFLTDLDSLIDKSKEFRLNVKDCSYNSIDIEFFFTNLWNFYHENADFFRGRSFCFVSNRWKLENIYDVIKLFYSI